MKICKNALTLQKRKQFLVSVINAFKYTFTSEPKNAIPVADRVTTTLSVFSEFTNLAIKHQTVNLGQGFPDFDIPGFVREAGHKAMNEGVCAHQYTKLNGNPELLECLGKMYSPSFKRKINPQTDILVSNGATQVMFTILQGMINPGDEVICIEPFYDAYKAQIVMAGGVPRYVPLQLKTDSSKFDSKQSKSCQDQRVDCDLLKKTINKRTKLLILNNPHNPSGKVFTPEELAEISDIVRPHKQLNVLADEVYEFLLYDGLQHHRIANMPGMEDRVITVCSAGKTFSTTGWKIGWAIAHPKFIYPTAMAHQFIPFCVSNPLQMAVKFAFDDVMSNNNKYLQEVPSFFQKKRDFLMQGLSRVGLMPMLSKSGYFVLADISNIVFPVQKGQQRDFEFCRWLSQEVGVTPIPPSYFYSDPNKHMGQQYARFCFAKKDEVLQEAVIRLAKHMLK